MKAPQNDIGTIIMKMPNGKKSAIVVSLGPKGTVNIMVQRSSEGEALIFLPASVAKQLSDHLATAAALVLTSTPRNTAAE